MNTNTISKLGATNIHTSTWTISESSPSKTKSSNHPLTILYEMKTKKLLEQKILSDQLHEISMKLNESSQQVCKNLQLAIAISKRIGSTFQYYEKTSDIVNIEQSTIIQKLVNDIAKINQELERMNDEIRDLEKKERYEQQQRDLMSNTMKITKFHEWYDTYGRSSDTMKESHRSPLKMTLNSTNSIIIRNALNVSPSRTSTFSPSSRIYGGTAHHPGFKSVASTMSPGSIIN